MFAGHLLVTILVIVLVLALLGSFPSFGYNRSWGYYPFGGLGGILILIIVLAVLGVL